MHRPSLSVFSLVMMNIIAVDSLRNLPMGAEYGFSVVFFYLLAGLVFFLPLILVIAELATTYPKTGGLYIWIREAFGPRWGLCAIWLQWIYNIVWFPTILIFLATTFLYLINPNLINNRPLLLVIILALFWGATAINCLGIRSAAFFSAIGAIIGTLIPMFLIMGLALYWVYSDQPIQTSLSWQNFWPQGASLNNISFFLVILFGLVGMEASAAHAGDVKKPHRDFPNALLLSGLIILMTLTCASLAIAIVVPNSELNIVSGLIAAYQIFFKSYGLGWLTPIIAGLIVLGGLACVSVWILAPARSLAIASQDGYLPAYFIKTNRHHIPARVLVLQGGLFSLLSTLLLFFPLINSSYWLLSAMAAQFALIVYIIMFAAAYVLRKREIHDKNSFKIPGGKFGLILSCSVGSLTCLVGIGLGFLPPSDIKIPSLLTYELLIIGGILILGSIPWCLKKTGSSSHRNN